MPSSASVNCKLNARFKAAVKNERFYTGTKAQGVYGVSSSGLKDRSNRNFFAANTMGSMKCCGLRELDFQGLSKTNYHENPNKEAFAEAVASYIKMQAYEEDNRVVIVGIPSRVRASSQYNVGFYDRLREVLLNFGFKQMCEAYQNMNSSNDIVALVGQMP